MKLLLPYNPLVYPGGAPGFDPGHIAGKNVVFSASCVPGGNFINLLTGGKGSLSGTVSAVMDGGVGPASFANTTLSGVSFTGQHTGVDSNFTIAALFRAVGHASGVSGRGVIFETGQFEGVCIQQDNSGALNLSFLNVSDTFIPSFTMTNGAVYFVAFSNLGSTSANFVVRRLDTGQVATSGSMAQTHTMNSGGGNYVIVGDTSNANFFGNCNVAAAMYSTRYMSLQDMLTWATDPWSFWYPRRLSTSVFSSVAHQATAIARLRTLVGAGT